MTDRPDDPTSPRRRSRPWPLIVAGVLLVAGIVVLDLFPPAEHDFYPKCVLHLYTGLHCPGCGLTRSAASLVGGEFAQALAYNLLWPLILPVLVWSLGTSLWNSSFPQRAIHSGLPKWFLAASPWVLVVLLLGFGILRNIPAEPFCRLAPHELK